MNTYSCTSYLVPYNGRFSIDNLMSWSVSDMSFRGKKQSYSIIQHNKFNPLFNLAFVQLTYSTRLEVASEVLCSQSLGKSVKIKTGKSDCGVYH